MAVVLGIEVPALFDCRIGESHDEAWVKSKLDYYYTKGVRHVFPLHNTDNLFGGTAIYNEIFALENSVLTGEHWDVTTPEPGSLVDFHMGMFDLPREQVLIDPEATIKKLIDLIIPGGWPPPPPRAGM
jgi:hypothetical protein